MNRRKEARSGRVQGKTWMGKFKFLGRNLLKVMNILCFENTQIDFVLFASTSLLMVFAGSWSDRGKRLSVDYEFIDWRFIVIFKMVNNRTNDTKEK